MKSYSNMAVQKKGWSSKFSTCRMVYNINACLFTVLYVAQPSFCEHNRRNLQNVLQVFVLKSSTSTGVIHSHRKSSNMGKRLGPFRKATDFCGSRILPVVVYSKIYILVYGTQWCKNLIASLLEKQLKTGQIHNRINHLHEICRVAFLSLLSVSSFCISHLTTQFCCVLFTHSSDLGRKIAAPRSKCLDIGGNCMNFYLFFIVHSHETMHTCMTFIAFLFLLEKRLIQSVLKGCSEAVCGEEHEYFQITMKQTIGSGSTVQDPIFILFAMFGN